MSDVLHERDGKDDGATGERDDGLVKALIGVPRALRVVLALVHVELKPAFLCALERCRGHDGRLYRRQLRSRRRAEGQFRFLRWGRAGHG